MKLHDPLRRQTTHGVRRRPAWIAVALLLLTALLQPAGPAAAQTVDSGATVPPWALPYVQDKLTDGTLNTGSTGNHHYGPIQGTVAAAALDAGPIQSDDFNRNNLDTSVWEFVNPLNDGWTRVTGVGTDAAQLELGVPEGVSHDPFNVNKAVRVMQAVSDNDFEVEVGFAGVPSQRFQAQGIIVEQDEGNWLRFDILHDGTDKRLYTATTTNGVTTVGAASGPIGGDSVVLNLERMGDSWTFRGPGQTPGQTLTLTLTSTLTVAKIGLFAANHASPGETPPAFTAEVDYFFNTAAPVDPEDGAEAADTLPPLIHGLRWVSNVDGQLTVSWYTDEPADGSVDYGPTNAYGTTVNQAGPNGYEHEVTLTGLTSGATYHMLASSRDAGSRTGTSGDIEFVFDDITIWYGDTQQYGQLGNPQTWVNILGNVSQGVETLEYRLNGGPIKPLTIGPDLIRLQNPGDFNIDLRRSDLTSGANEVQIVARDDTGNVMSTKIVTVNYQAGNQWPLPYNVDWSTITTPDEILTKAEIIDGKWALDGASVRTDEPGYDRFIGMGDVKWNDYVVTVPVTINELPDSGMFGAGILLRWNGHTDVPLNCGQPKCGYHPLGAIAWYRGFVQGNGNVTAQLELFGNDDEMIAATPFPLTVGETYIFKARVETTATGGRYQLKVWEEGESEPAEWILSGTETLQDPQRGSAVLLAHFADTSFGTVNIASVGTPSFPPVATDDVGLVAPGGSVVINILDNDGAPGGALTPSSAVIVQPPLHGNAVTDPVTGAVTYAHDGGSSTSDTFAYRVANDAGLSSNVATVTVTVSPDAPSDILSDDFNSCELQPFWQIVDPVGQGTVEVTGIGSGDATLDFTLAQDVTHDAWSSEGNTAVRVMQSAPNSSFEIDAHFKAEPQGDFNNQGILIEEDGENFIRYDVFHSGDGLSLFVGKTANGANQVEFNQGVIAGSTLYLRVKRTGNTWEMYHSPDGADDNWTMATSFTHALQVKRVGIFAANPTGAAYATSADYFFNTTSPIDPEDGGINAITFDVQGTGTVDRSPSADTYPCGQQVTLTANPGPGFVFDRWGGAASGTESPTTVTVNGPTNVTAIFVAGSVDRAPVITLIGDNPAEIALGGTFTDPGATATDPEDGDITSQIVVGGDTVNTNLLGLYTVTYDVTDSAGNPAVQQTRVVNVVDKTAPTIVLNGPNPLNLRVGDPYTDPGAEAVDNVDGDLTSSIVVGGDTVDTSTEGTYVVTYSVSDSSGNSATASRAVTVLGADATFDVYLPLIDQ